KTQVDTFTAIDKELTAKQDTLYSELARYLVTHRDNVDDPEVKKKYRDLGGVSQRLLVRLGPRVKQVLTPGQYAMLPTYVTIWFDMDEKQYDKLFGPGGVVYFGF